MDNKKEYFQDILKQTGLRQNEWIYVVLKKKGITQKELAHRIGMVPSVLSDKLHCRREFLYSEIVQICAELDIENPLPLFQTKKLLKN